MTDTITKLLVEAGSSAASADNTQPWHFTRTEHQLIVSYDFARVNRHTFPADSPATLLSLGMVYENLHQLIDYLGIKSELHINVSNPEAYVVISGLPAVGQDTGQNLYLSAKEQPLFGRHTNRLPFQTSSLAPEVLNALSSCSTESCKVTTYSGIEQLTPITNLIKQASVIRFQTQEVHEWLAHSLRFGNEAVERADGLDVKTLHLPPGGRLFLRFISDWRRMNALNHLGAYKILAAMDSLPIKSSPAVIAITGGDSAESSFAAGRTLGKVWTLLNSMNVAVHPYYVISDQLQRHKNKTIPAHLNGVALDLHKQASAFFELHTSDTLHMLLRVGYPTKAPHKSLRLPVDRILTIKPTEL